MIACTFMENILDKWETGFRTESVVSTGIYKTEIIVIAINIMWILINLFIYYKNVKSNTENTKNDLTFSVKENTQDLLKSSYLDKIKTSLHKMLKQAKKIIKQNKDKKNSLEPSKMKIADNFKNVDNPKWTKINDKKWFKVLNYLFPLMFILLGITISILRLLKYLQKYLICSKWYKEATLLICIGLVFLFFRWITDKIFAIEPESPL